MLCVHHLFLHCPLWYPSRASQAFTRDPTATLPATGELHLPVLAATLLWLGELPTIDPGTSSDKSSGCGEWSIPSMWPRGFSQIHRCCRKWGLGSTSNMIQPEATWIQASTKTKDLSSTSNQSVAVMRSCGLWWKECLWCGCTIPPEPFKSTGAHAHWVPGSSGGSPPWLQHSQTWPPCLPHLVQLLLDLLLLPHLSNLHLFLLMPALSSPLQLLWSCDRSVHHGSVEWATAESLILLGQPTDGGWWRRHDCLKIKLWTVLFSKAYS